MEQKAEEIITNETSKSVEFSGENFDIVMNHIELEGSSLHMHGVSDHQHLSSALINSRTDEMCLTDHTCTYYYPMNHAGCRISEVITRSYECANGYITSCSLMPKDKGSLELSLKESSLEADSKDKSLLELSLKELSFEADSNSKVTNLPLSDSLSKTSLTCNTIPTHVAQGSNNPTLPHYGINLREWLECKGVKASKNDKLCLFRKIVQIVDVAHSKNIALMELRPSSFILFRNGDVKYIGSQIESEMWNVKHDNRKKRGLDIETYHDKLHEKMQKVGEETCFISRFLKDKHHFSMANIDMKSSCFIHNAQKNSIYEGTSCGEDRLTSDITQLEKRWYAFPEGFKIKDLLSLNVYSLGLFLFEFLFYFESLEAHSTAMLDLHHQILPPSFISENPRESELCFWVLDSEHSSRPTTRDILESELIYGFDDTKQSNDEASSVDMVDDTESDLLLHFLVTLEQHIQCKVSNLLRSMKFLDVDINVVESRLACSKTLYKRQVNDSNVKDGKAAESRRSISKSPRNEWLENINKLENVYFTMRSNAQLSGSHVNRVDIDVLRKREELSLIQTADNLPTIEETFGDPIGTFFDGICKFARYKRFEVCGTLKNNILSSNNLICSLGFDREEEYIAATGLSKKIKIFEFASLLDDYDDVQYPILEMSNKSEFSSICWNKYIRNYLASADYDGLVKIWDSNTGQDIAQYNEHQKRAWSVDFSQVDPTKFATGGDDCFLKLWSINERNSICTIWNPANICCVQLSSYSSHLLAFGSADSRIRCYDVRHTRIPWCTLSGHGNSVSYVRFLDSETIISASTDNSLKRWDLMKTSLDGLSPNACTLTFNGHTNKKSFVGLAVMDGFIACGSETNEVYTYYKSMPMTMSRHKFGNEVSDGDEHYVSSVRWRRKSQMLVAANSNGTINILRFASP